MRADLNMKPLTTGKVAELCGVSLMTIWNWITGGKIKAYRTPGGHFRILPGDFKTFIEEYEIPLEEKNPFFLPKRVMVVDDEVEIVEALSTVLQQKIPQVELIPAYDGYEALIQIGHVKPDLIVLDLRMPRIDGFEVCKELKSNPLTRHITIIAISGCGTDINISRIKESGADFYLDKPFDMDQFLTLVRKCLGFPQPEPEGSQLQKV